MPCGFLENQPGINNEKVNLDSDDELRSGGMFH
ncbi:hypothetical protein AF42_01868 [Citrobacter freundii MGH 56]|jgi:hypothetical protein|nr:hypothetical protein AF42_01868 [Citrobacter freundii MGH 56]